MTWTTLKTGSVELVFKEFEICCGKFFIITE